MQYILFSGPQSPGLGAPTT